jgi:hypothetical protein
MRAQQAVPAAHTVRRLLPLLAWVAALGAAFGLLLLMGRGGLSTPSILEPSAWPAWATGHDPVEVAFAVLRLVGLAAAWYLLGVTTIGVVARLLRWGRLVDAADILTVPSVRRLLQAALGLGLATAAVTGTTIDQVSSDVPGVVVAVQDPAGPREIIPIAATGRGANEPMQPVSPATSTQVVSPMAAQVPPAVSTPVPPAVSEQVPPAVSTPVPPAVSEQVPPSVSVQVPPAVSVQVPPAVSEQASQPVPAPAGSAQTQTPAQGAHGTYVVQHGDHLWGIAEKTLEKAWGHPPSDAQIVPYWQHLIEANRAAFVDPGNPDLILPGQTFTVPPPPPSPG